MSSDSPLPMVEIEPSEAEAPLGVLERLEAPNRPCLERERRDLAVGRVRRALDDLAHPVEALVGVVDVRLLGREIGMGHATRMSARRRGRHYAGAR